MDSDIDGDGGSETEPDADTDGDADTVRDEVRARYAHSFSGILPAEKILRLYREYFITEDERLINQMLLLSEPFIDAVISCYRNKREKWLMPGTEKDARQQVLIKMWRYAQRGTIPIGPSDFQFWLWKVVRGEWVKEKVRYTHRAYDFEYAGARPQVANIFSPRDMENFIFIRQIKELVQERVLSRVRFYGTDREACVFILDKVVRGVRLVPDQLVSQFELVRKDARFFIGYMTCLVRDALFHIRDEGLLEQSWLDFICNSGVIYNELIFTEERSNG